MMIADDGSHTPEPDVPIQIAVYASATTGAQTGVNASAVDQLETLKREQT